MISLDEVPLLTEDETAVDALAELSAPSANRGLVVDNGHLAGLLDHRPRASARGWPKAGSGTERSS